MLLHLPRSVATSRSPTPPLDVEVAVRLGGFRWVRWRAGWSPDAPRDSHGKFLAREDDRLAHAHRPAPPSLQLAPQPYRHVPPYSADVGLALQACEHAGLFREGGAALHLRADGRWELAIREAELLLDDATLPELLTRGALAWQGAMVNPSR